MLSVPLPMLAGFIFVLTLQRSLAGVEASAGRRYFYAFLTLYAVQGVLVGLRFGYGLERLAPIVPVTAAVMPPLAFLAFSALSDRPPRRPWLHLLPPLAVALAVALLRDLVDLLLLVTFLGYGLAIYRLTTGDGDAVVEAALQRRNLTLRAARLTAGLMIFFGLSDAALALYASVYGGDAVPAVVGMMSLAAIVVVLVYFLLPERTVPAPQAEVVAILAPSPEDLALMARIEAALDEGDLFKDENLSLAKLARRAALLPREVSATINRVRAQNVSQFVNDRRIREACRLLKETRKPLSQVMFDSGFSTKSNFNREFRRVTGTSPARWRKSEKRTAG